MKKVFLLVCFFTSVVKAQKISLAGIKNDLHFGLEMNCHGGVSLMPIADQTSSNYLITPSESSSGYLYGYNKVNNAKIRYSGTTAIFSGIAISPIIHQNFNYKFGLNGIAGCLINDAHQEWSYTNRFELGLPKLKFVIGLTKVKMRTAYSAYETQEYSTITEWFGSFYLSNFKSVLVGLKFENDVYSIEGGLISEYYKKPENKGKGFFLTFTHGNFSMFTRANFNVPLQVNPTRMSNPDVTKFNSNPTNFKFVFQFGIGVRLKQKYSYTGLFYDGN